MGKVGLEWFYRLLAEPRRLWKRYLLEPWFIAGLFLKQYLKSLTFRGGLGEL
jgi:N-acetylglucosaminyldiphosphoundecaprenol N-acetyl-beta-D-mannosaminyltransferase